MDHLLYRSRADGASASQGSLYFADGARIRLEHDHGPIIDQTPMDRFTFKQKDARNFHNKDDYKKRVRGLTRSGLGREAIHQQLGEEMLKDAVPGDSGKLFEVEEGQLGTRGARTHKSRGKPVAHTGIENQAHLASIVSIAREAGTALSPLRDAHDAAKAARKEAGRGHRHAKAASAKARHAHVAANWEFQQTRTAAGNAVSYQASAAADEEHEQARTRHDEALQLRRQAEARSLEAEAHLNAMTQRHRTARTRWKTGVAHYNGLIRATFTASQGAGSSAAPAGPRHQG